MTTLKGPHLSEAIQVYKSDVPNNELSGVNNIKKTFGPSQLSI